MIKRGLLLAAALTLAAGPVWAASAACTPHSVKVTGQGSASAAPQVYTFHVAIARRGNQPKSLTGEVGKRAAAAVHAARSAGIARDDIQSTAITVHPVYNANAKPDAPQVYEVQRAMTLTLRKPGRYGDLVQALMGAGINRISHVSAQAADPKALADKALAAAVSDARHKAALIAKSLGVAVGAPLEIDERGGQGPRPMIMGAMRTNNQRGGYEPGKITVHAEVRARFALSPSGCPQP